MTFIQSEQSCSAGCFCCLTHQGHFETWLSSTLQNWIAQVGNRETSRGEPHTLVLSSQSFLCTLFPPPVSYFLILSSLSLVLVCFSFSLPHPFSAFFNTLSTFPLSPSPFAAFFPCCYLQSCQGCLGISNVCKYWIYMLLKQPLPYTVVYLNNQIFSVMYWCHKRSWHFLAKHS